VAADFKLQEAEARNKELQAAVAGKKKEGREAREKLEKARLELKVIQAKYEDELSAKEVQLEELRG
jgi:predicted DNA-binding transcriptional regulator YafY